MGARWESGLVGVCMHFVDRQSLALSPMHACPESTSATTIYLQHGFFSNSLNKPILSAYRLGLCALCNTPPASARPLDHGEVVARLRGRREFCRHRGRGGGAPCPRFGSGYGWVQATFPKTQIEAPSRTQPCH